MATDSDWLLPSEAARLLGMSSDAVRVMADRGKLAVTKTASGRRMFRRVDVDALVVERATNPSTRKRRQCVGPYDDCGTDE